MTDFRNIWMPLAERFYRAAYYMLESQQDAEDAVQELYLRIWKSHANLTDLKSPAAYGMSLLKNICIDKIRRRESRRTEQLEEFIAADASGPEKQMSEKDTLSRVMKEMERLPEKQYLHPGRTSRGKGFLRRNQFLTARWEGMGSAECRISATPRRSASMTSITSWPSRRIRRRSLRNGAAS